MKRRHLFPGIFAALLLAVPAGAFAQAPGYASDAPAADHFIVSGAVGGAFGGDVTDGTFGFDGAFDYLRNGKYGFEFLGTFTPDLPISRSAGPFLGDTQVNTYMFNGIGALPLGIDDSWMPYVSGGLGIITVRDNATSDAAVQLVDEGQFGGNIGAGIMAFRGPIGFRADLRYFTGLGNDVDLQLGEDVNFWRSTGGVAFRW